MFVLYIVSRSASFSFFFFFNDTATTEIYTLSLHDALPISPTRNCATRIFPPSTIRRICCGRRLDRKSTRLNSSHSQISYAVFCLKKKKTTNIYRHQHYSHSNQPHTMITTYDRSTCT